MDPTANLKEQLDLASWLTEREAEDKDKVHRVARELAQLVEDLHRWILRGGALPEQWRK